ncbi:M23 family metallopeptidase [Niallia sp. FSL R7-0271]|uniref:M23 family metallopeptidase n=1 Tax=Niallia sp. FSL R7-0271 TaxID=2921678 RepID=UPI0030F64FC9
MRKICFLAVLLAFLAPNIVSHAAENKSSVDDTYYKRMELYEKIEAVTQLPWYYIAAVDQYERNIRASRRDLPKATGLIGIYFPKETWAGIINPDSDDTNPKSIAFFGGLGVDGNGDGKADSLNDEDVLFTFANHILKFGVDEDNFRIGLWDYYKRDKTVSIIMGKAAIYRHFGRLNLDDHAFPVPLRSNYSYRSTWGDARGWGGKRIHEGTDIFADYSVPVRATSYGIIEMKGWNRYGGWRIGIRDINNNYHYFAHLSGFAKDVHNGMIVEPGMLIGGVGSSGYGPPGTSGKFPPHLHYGMYKDNGKTEWSYDPFSHLKVWERQERIKLKAKK